MTVTDVPTPAARHAHEAHDAVGEVLELDGISDDQSKTIAAVYDICAYAVSKLGSGHGFLAPESAGVNVVTAATAIRDQARVFRNTKNAQNLGAMARAAEDLIAQLVFFQSPPEGNDEAERARAMGQYRSLVHAAVKRSRSAISSVESRAAAVSENLKSLQARIKEDGDRLSNVTSQYQLQFAKAQEDRLKDFSEAQKGHTEAFATLLEELRGDAEKRDQEITDGQVERIKSWEGELASARINYTEAATRIVAELERQKGDVERLVGVVGNLAVTSGYLKTANLSRRLMWVWQLATVSTLVTLVIVAMEYFLPASQGAAAVSWQAYGTRVLIAVALGILAAYCAAQGEKAASAEKRNRRMALELEAIGPFLDPLSDEEKSKFRIQLGERSFGHDPDTVPAPKQRDPWTMFGHLLREKDFREVVLAAMKMANHS